MQTRRRFVQMVPLAGVAALTACGDKTAPQPAAPTPVAAPAPAPDPAPSAPSASASTAVDATPAPAPAQKVAPGDPMAVALGYVPNATTTKSPKYIAGSACANCALFGGKAGDASGPCPLFGGKLVASPGWCTAYVKKA